MPRPSASAPERPAFFILFASALLQALLWADFAHCQTIYSVQSQSTAPAAAPTAPGPLAASSAGALSLEDVVQTALTHHPSLRAARAKVDGAEAKLLATEGAFDTKLGASGKWQPNGKNRYGLASVGVEQDTPYYGLSAQGGWRLGAGDVPVYFGDDDTAPGGEFFVGFALPLLQGGPIDRARTDIAQADLGVDAARVDGALVALEIRRSASIVYWQWVAAGLALDIERKLLDIALARDSQLRAKVEKGELPAIEGLENQRAIAARRGRVVKAEAVLAEAAYILSIFFRAESGEPVVVEANRLPQDLIQASPHGPWSQSIAELAADAVRRRPDLKRLGLDEAIVQQELEWAENQRLPRLDVALDVAQMVRPPDELSGKDTEVQLGLKLTVPLQLRKATGQAAAARADLIQIANRARLVQDRLVADLGAVRVKIDAALRSTELAEQELAVARQVEAGEARRLELGDSTLLILNLREVATADAAQKVVSARAEVLRALADWEAVTAQPFPVGSPFAEQID